MVPCKFSLKTDMWKCVYESSVLLGHFDVYSRHLRFGTLDYYEGGGVTLIKWRYWHRLWHAESPLCAPFGHICVPNREGKGWLLGVSTQNLRWLGTGTACVGTCTVRGAQNPALCAVCVPESVWGLPFRKFLVSTMIFMCQDGFQGKWGLQRSVWGLPKVYQTWGFWVQTIIFPLCLRFHRRKQWCW